jgi:hypothetical protein
VRRITAEAFHKALVAAGVVRDGESIRRIVIDAQAGNAVVVMHVERYGDDRLLNVVRTLEGVEIREERRTSEVDR